jgi:Polyketide cyclase / dehydrase and lipid transport
MLKLVHEEFVVDVPVETAWNHLAQVENWPSWAKHIKRVELKPPGRITPNSQGKIYLRMAPASTFKVTEFVLHKRWKWVGPFLWMTVYYDHTFEPVDTTHTRMAFIVHGEGFGIRVFGRIFGAVYNANLRRAIPNLIAELNALGANGVA